MRSSRDISGIFFIKLRKQARCLKSPRHVPKQCSAGPAFWFEINPVEYNFGMGFYNASAEQTQAWRDSIEANPAAFERILDDLDQHPELEIAGPMYKRPKKDMGKRLNPWYNQRQVQVICTREFGGDLYKPEFPLILAEEFAALVPLYDYFMAHCPPEPYR